MRVAFLSLLLLVVLSGCGGGGGGGSGGGLSLSLSPQRVDVAQFVGEQRSLLIVGAVDGSVSGPVTVRVLDDRGVVDSVNVFGSGPEYGARILTRSTLAMGLYSGTLRVQLCSDAGCATRYGESSLPYTLQVLAATATDLRPLSPAIGVGDWTTFQGSAAHTGLLPMTVDPSRFTLRWLWDDRAGLDVRVPAPVCNSALGLCYVNVRTQDGGILVALRQSDGTEAWSVSTVASGPPTVDDQRVYVAGISPGAGRLLAYDATSGSPLFDTASPQPGGGEPGAPAVVNGGVYVNFGALADTLARSGQIQAFDAGSGAYRWTSQTGGYAGVAPAADAGHVYFYRPNSSFTFNFPDGFTAIKTDDGAQDYTIVRPAQGPGQEYYNGGTPVIDGDGGVLVSALKQAGFVDRYGLATQSRLWSVESDIASPVVANGVVYVADHGGFAARRLSDGVLLWSWSSRERGGEGSFNFGMALTSNVIFVGVDEEVVGIDLSTHRVVWAYPRPGAVSLSSSGVLYIARARRELSGSTYADGTVAAINVR